MASDYEANVIPRIPSSLTVALMRGAVQRLKAVPLEGDIGERLLVGVAAASFFVEARGAV